MNDFNLPGPGDQCVCRSYYACYCRPEPDPQDLFDEAYERGYDACLTDGADDHPLACWPENHVDSVVGIDGRRFYGSNWFSVPRAWRLRGLYGLDPFRREPCPEGYVAGFEDAMCGLPSAVADPERHRACAAALDAYEPEPDRCRSVDLYDRPLGPWPVPTEVEDWLPF